MHSIDITTLRNRAAELGFDLVQPFALGWYNDAVAPDYRWPGRADALGLLIGHTRALWTPFVAAWRADPALQADVDPLDRYTATRLASLLQGLRIEAELRQAYEPPPRRIAIQRLAEVCGLAPVSAVGLNIHPIYGPWIGLRGALLLDADAPSGATPRIADPCVDCVHTCMPAFERARRAPGELVDTWRLWLAVRDACPIGREHRYSEEQIRYHYTKDRAVLATA